MGSEDAAKLSHNGAPSNISIHDYGLSTDISGDNRDSHGKYLDQSGRETARTMQKWQRRIRVSAHGERKLASMLSKISEISDSLHFSNPIRDEASLILRKSTKRDFASGRKSAEGMAVASLYLACRKMGVNRSLKEIPGASRDKRTCRPQILPIPH